MDRVVDPDGPATDTGSTSTDGDSPGWTPPPWSPKAAAGDSPGWTPPPWSPKAAAGDSPGRTPPPWSPDAARPSWKLILGGCLIAAIVLLGPVGWLFDASRSATGAHKVAPAEPTQVPTEVATADEIDESEDLNWDEINVDDSVALRVGDCFNLKDPDAEIEHVRKVPCATEHDYELFYVGAMRKRSHPTENAIQNYLIDYCNPAFGHYIGKDYNASDLDYDYLVPTEDAWRSGDRTVQCAAYGPGIDRVKGSLRGTHR